MAKCPTNYFFVRNASCLDPRNMVQDPEKCGRKFKGILKYLSQANKVDEKNCDTILLEFQSFLEDIPHKYTMDFENFDRKNSRLDSFLSQFLSCEARYARVWEVAKIIMIFSHGQASVERGFSVNKNIEVENLNDLSYVSQRIVYDYLKSYNNVNEVPISNELRKSASSSRMRYYLYWEENKKLQQSTVTQNKRKAVSEEIDFMKRKKIFLEKEVIEILSNADSCAERAEVSKDISLFIKSNNFRKVANEKKDVIISLDQQIEEKSKELKSL